MNKNKSVVSILHTTFQNDNRVLRMAQSIEECGFNVTIVAWQKNQLPAEETIEGIQVNRINPPFNQYKRRNKLIGLIQFVSFSWMAVLQYRKKDIWHCNDLEGLFIGLLAKISRPKIILIYDSHELQSGRLGLSKGMQAMIRLIERIAIPLTHCMITVSPGIVQYYSAKFKQKVHLIRNIPNRMKIVKNDYFRDLFKLPLTTKIFLYQGGLVPGRGIELLMDTFEKRRNNEAILVIMGDGKLAQEVKERSERSFNIYYHPAVPYSRIAHCTSSADIGFNMAQNNCLNHQYCLPNKLFEYIQCELPVISNDLEDCNNLIRHYQIGVIIEEYTELGVNKAINEFLEMDNEKIRINCIEAKQQLEWEKEKLQLQLIYNSLFEVR